MVERVLNAPQLLHASMTTSAVLVLADALAEALGLALAALALLALVGAVFFAASCCPPWTFAVRDLVARAMFAVSRPS